MKLFISLSGFLSKIKNKNNVRTYPRHHGIDCGTSKPGKPKLKTLKNGLKNGSIGRLNETPESLFPMLGFESPIVPDTTSKSV